MSRTRRATEPITEKLRQADVPPSGVSAPYSGRLSFEDIILTGTRTAESYGEDIAQGAAVRCRANSISKETPAGPPFVGRRDRQTPAASSIRPDPTTVKRGAAHRSV